MPSNIIKINNGGKGFEYNVQDSKMDELIKHLNENGDLYNPVECTHQHTIKTISIPITNDGMGELDYDELLSIVQKIVNKDTLPGFTWFEVLVCIDCDTVLEQNDVTIPD